MYTCGPSTYQRAHIGNYRTFLFEDILQRYLEFLGYNVTRLITLTNIEDKAISQAQKEKASVEDLTSRNEAIFFHEFELLHIKRPDFTVRASTIADQAVRLIETLVQKGIVYPYSYEGRKNYYYDPLKFAGFGKLAHLNMKEWPNRKRRFHLDTYPGMPWNKGDFILWHGCCSTDRVCWDTEVGRGRPAWNIQDAAMVTDHLGFSIDVACGGIDNLVRHHDYTIAVAEAASCKPFSRYWLHGGHLNVDGKKMSKSKGNVLYPDDLIAKGYQPRHLRFFLIYGPYAEKHNFTWEKLAETTQQLDAFRKNVSEIQQIKAENTDSTESQQSLSGIFQKHMDNNLDVRGAFDKLFEALKKLLIKIKAGKINQQSQKAALDELHQVDEVLQVIF
jgi:cysteinyl-tRNA synthetase